MPNINNYIQSGNPALFAGPILFRQGRADTPLLSILGGKRRNTNSEVFIVGQHYASPTASDSVVSEHTAAKQLPDFAPVGREQTTNVVQLHTKSIASTDYSTGNRGMLAGEFNLAGQTGVPVDEIQYQRAQKVLELRQDIERDIINSRYAYRNGDNSKVNRTRGLVEAIKTNHIDVGGNELSWNHLNQLLIQMADHGAATHGLVLGCNDITASQLAIEAKAEHNAVTTGVAKINGIDVTQIQTIRGVVSIINLRYLPDGVALLLNLGALSLVEQPFRNGGWTWFKVAREAGSEAEMLQGAWGLDYGYEGCHGILTNIATGYTPYQGTKVFVANKAVPSTEVLPVLAKAVLAGAQVGVATEALALEYTGVPVEDATLTYKWQIANSAVSAFSDIEGANAATYTPTEEQVGKYIRCVVTAADTATGTVISNCKKVSAAE